MPRPAHERGWPRFTLVFGVLSALATVPTWIVFHAGTAAMSAGPNPATPFRAGENVDLTIVITVPDIRPEQPSGEVNLPPEPSAPHTIPISQTETGAAGPAGLAGRLDAHADTPTADESRHRSPASSRGDDRSAPAATPPASRKSVPAEEESSPNDRWNAPDGTWRAPDPASNPAPDRCAPALGRSGGVCIPSQRRWRQWLPGADLGTDADLGADADADREDAGFAWRSRIATRGQASPSSSDPLRDDTASACPMLANEARCPTGTSTSARWMAGAESARRAHSIRAAG